jgi:hypothetical protein
MRRIAIAALLSCCVAGCDDDLPKVTLLSHMRILGARTEVDGDRSRSTPKPGESARMTWSVGFPDAAVGDDQLASLFLSCTAPDRYTGNPVCQEIIDAATGKRPPGFGLDAPTGCDVNPNSTQMVANIELICVTGTPTLDVKVPASAKQKRLVQGIICRNGVPQFDLSVPTGVSCRRNDGVSAHDFESISVSGMLAVQFEDTDENHNPNHELLEVSMRSDKAGTGRPWLPTPSEMLPALVEDCSSAPPGVIETNSGHTQVIEISYPRDQLEDDEELVISTYATLGELSRRFTVIEREPVPESEEPPDQTWELTEEQRDALLDKPTLVRFFFTMSDGRGGFDVTTREVCVARQ